MNWLDGLLTRFTERQLVQEQVPLTGRFYLSRILILLVLIVALVVRGTTPYLSVWWAIGTAAVGWYTGVGVLAPVRYKNAYERGYLHGRQHPDGGTSWSKSAAD